MRGFLFWLSLYTDAREKSFSCGFAACGFGIRLILKHLRRTQSSHARKKLSGTLARVV